MAALITTKLDIENINFNLSSSIDTALAVPSVNAVVVDFEKRFYSINVADAMGQLTQVGDLLQTAYAASIGHKCNSDILRVLAEYQPLVGDSFVTTGVFVSTSLAALEKHKLAYKVAKKGEGDALKRALTIMLKCGDLAGRMAVEAGAMKARADTLCEKSRESLILCSKDECLEMEKRNDITRMIKKMEAEQVFFTSLKEDLAQQVEEAKQRERRATVRKDDAQKQQFILGLVNGIVSPLAQAGANLVPQVAISNVVARATTAGMTATEAAVTRLQQQVTEEFSRLSTIQEAADGPTATDVAAKAGKAAGEALGNVANIAIQAAAPKIPDGSKKEADGKVAEGPTAADVAGKAGKAVVESLGNVANIAKEQAYVARDEEDRCAQQRMVLEQEMRNNNADLRATLKKMENMKISENSLGVAIESLKATVQSLAKICNIFENTRLFWIGVQRHCKDLENASGNLEGDVEEGFKEDFMEKVVQNAMSWLALAHINQCANEKMREVNATISGIMCNLPDKRKAQQLISKNVKLLLQDLVKNDEVMAELK